MEKEILKDFFEKHIKGTQEKSMVSDRKIFLCSLTVAVLTGLGIEESVKGVYVTSRCLKHLFDKKPAEEFFFLLDNLHKVAKYPDKIYMNKNGKRGSFCFVKRIGNAEYLGSIEIVKISSAKFGKAVFGMSEFGRIQEMEEIQIATAFRLRDIKYIKNYTLLWDWGNGNPHRSVLDTLKESTNAPQ